MKRWKLTALVLGIAPLMSGAGGRAAAAPTTQPAEVTTGNISARSEPTTRPDRFTGPGEGGRRNRLASGMRGDRPDPGTVADWESINGFMKTHSPNRLQFINGLSDGPLKFGMMKNMVQKSNNLDRLEKDDPELAQIMAKRVGLEDDVFGLATQYRKADAMHADAIRTELQGKVADLVDANLNEREMRLARLEKTLEEQRQNLEKDQNQRDRLIADRLRGIMDEARRPNSPLNAAQGEPVLASPDTKTDVTTEQKQK